MELLQTEQGFFLRKENTVIGRCVCRRQPQGWHLEQLELEPAWQGKGYGSFFPPAALKLPACTQPRRPRPTQAVPC